MTEQRTASDRSPTEVVSMMDGLQLQWLLAPDEIDTRGTFRHYTARLRTDIRA